MAEEKNLTLSIVPLYLIELAGGKLRGRTRLQKLVFLAQKHLKDQIDYKFTKGWYGPVSYTLMDLVQTMAAIGMVEEHIDKTAAGFNVTEYRLTRDGKELVDFAEEAHAYSEDDYENR